MNLLTLLSLLTVLNSDSTDKFMPCKQDTVNGAVFISVEQMPVYPGGETALLNEIKRLFVLPSNCNGKVYLAFVVNCNGYMSNFKIQKAEADLNTQREVMKITPRFQAKWSPGLQNGKPVNVDYVMTLRFRDGKIVYK